MLGGLFILTNGNKLSLTFSEFSRLLLLFLFRDPFPKVSSFLRHGHTLVLGQKLPADIFLCVHKFLLPFFSKLCLQLNETTGFFLDYPLPICDLQTLPKCELVHS